MGHYTQDMNRIPLKYHINVLFYTKYTHPTLICRGTDGRTENIYSIFRDKLLLPGEHVFSIKLVQFSSNFFDLDANFFSIWPFLKFWERLLDPRVFSSGILALSAFWQEGLSFPRLALRNLHLFLLKMLITVTTAVTFPVFAVLLAISSAFVVSLRAVSMT